MAKDIQKINISLILHKEIVKQNSDFPRVINDKFLSNSKFIFLGLSKMTVSLCQNWE